MNSTNEVGRAFEKKIVDHCCQASHNMYVACIFSELSDRKKQRLEKMIIEEVGDTIFIKEVILHDRALRNLSMQIQDDPARRFFDSVLARSTKKNGFMKGSIPSVFCFFECCRSLQISRLKKKIEILLKNSDLDVYIMDRNDGSLNIAQIILNKNSLDLIMCGNLKKYPEIDDLIDRYKKHIIKSGADLEDYIIDSSTVIALYGLRRSNDLDFLTLDDKCRSMDDDKIENHISELQYHQKTLDQLILNPQNHLYYKGVKLVSLECIRNFKKNRRDPKDVYDILLIDALRKRKHSVFFICIRCAYYLHEKCIRGLKDQMRNMISILKLKIQVDRKSIFGIFRIR